MALAPLATQSDLAARGVVVDPSESVAVDSFLAAASSLVRDAADSPISQTTSTVTLEARGDRVILPGQPVTAVSALSADGVAVSDYKLLSGSLTRPCGFQPGSELAVTYTHGLAEVPADIVDMVCRLAGQALAALRAGDATARQISSERIGDYQVSYATEAESGTLTLTKLQRDSLAARFGGGVGTARAL